MVCFIDEIISALFCLVIKKFKECLLNFKLKLRYKQ